MGNESAYYVYRVSEKAYIEEYELLEKDFMCIREILFKWEKMEKRAKRREIFEQEN